MLILDMLAEQRLRIGRLGIFSFPEGTYLYFGSASGPGGLQARIRHHMGISDRPFWHLDYLRPYVRIRACFITVSSQPLECAWQQKAVQVTPAVYPARKFGASDCRAGCAAHLLKVSGEVKFTELREKFREVGGDANFLPLNHNFLPKG